MSDKVFEWLGTLIAGILALIVLAAIGTTPSAVAVVVVLGVTFLIAKD